MIFRLSLTEEKVKRHQATALHLIVAFALFVAGIALCFLHVALQKMYLQKQIDDLHLSGWQHANWWGYGIIALGLVLTYIPIFKSTWLQQPKINRTLRFIELTFMLALGVGAALAGLYTPAILLGLIALAIIFALWWEGSGNQVSLHVEVSEAGIQLPVTSRRRHIRWPEVERVLLRYGALTIDCVDNRLFQWTVRPVDFDAAVFEAFCKTQVTAAISERVKEW